MIEDVIIFVAHLPQPLQILLAAFVVIILFTIFKKLIKLALTLFVILVIALAIFALVGL